MLIDATLWYIMPQEVYLQAMFVRGNGKDLQKTEEGKHNPLDRI